ncbi:hypothetical protein SAMN05720465_2692 [Fibrobacter sp. UWB10]|nr:hypothetical protein SAMN05720465_2692 [Fibrobacter sp. UWB10]
MIQRKIMVYCEKKVYCKPEMDVIVMNRQEELLCQSGCNPDDEVEAVFGDTYP